MELFVEKYDISCFIDTNIFLHYQMFTEIDWNKITNKRKVLLVICSTVIDELDNKKYSDPSKDIRSRAKKVITKLSEIRDKANINTHDNTYKIRENIDVLFIPFDKARIDWENQKLEMLDVKNNDDRIIASILTNTNLNKPVLVTSDLGFKLKAEDRNIKCITMPDEYRIELIKDNKDKEIEKLRKEIEYFKNRIPRLKIGFSNVNKDCIDHTDKDINAINILSEEDITKIIESEKASLEYKRDEWINNLYEKNHFGLDILRYSEEEIRRYNKDLEQYCLKLHKYYKDENIYQSIQSRTIELGFVLVNEGTQPAEDIEIFLYFTDSFKLFKNSEFLKKPLKPEKPIQPRNQLDMIQSRIKDVWNGPNSQISIDMKELRSSIDNVDIGEPIDPIIKKTTEGYEVKYKIKKLKHGLSIELNPVYILFKTIDGIKSFNMKYSILSDNIPDSIRGFLHVKLTKNVSKE